MFTKRVFTITFLVSISLFVFIGCGGGDDNQAAQEARTQAIADDTIDQPTCEAFECERCVEAAACNAEEPWCRPECYTDLGCQENNQCENTEQCNIREVCRNLVCEMVLCEEDQAGCEIVTCTDEEEEGCVPAHTLTNQSQEEDILDDESVGEGLLDDLNDEGAGEGSVDDLIDEAVGETGLNNTMVKLAKEVCKEVECTLIPCEDGEEGCFPDPNVDINASDTNSTTGNQTAGSQTLVRQVCICDGEECEVEVEERCEDVGLCESVECDEGFNAVDHECVEEPDVEVDTGDGLPPGEVEVDGGNETGSDNSTGNTSGNTTEDNSTSA